MTMFHFRQRAVAHEKNVFAPPGEQMLRGKAPALAIVGADRDVLLAAQVSTYAHTNTEVVVASMNARHLSRFVNAKMWHEIA